MCYMLSNIHVSGEETKRYALENDLQCGLSTTGSDECWWDCKFERFQYHLEPWFYLRRISNFECLDDCYPPDHCLSRLIGDYKAAGGICKGSYLDTFYNANGSFNVSKTICEFNEESSKPWDIKTGLCSEKTETLLLDQKNCIHPLYSQKQEVLYSIYDRINSLCKKPILYGFWPEPLTDAESKSEVKSQNKTDKLNPIEYVEVVNNV